MNVSELIRNELLRVLKQCDFPTDLQFVVEIPKDTSKGDYATNIAMQLTRILRRNPQEIAKQIVANFNLENAKVSKIEIAGPGFLNFFMANDSFDNLIKKINQNPETFGTCNYGKGKKFNVEFVSANPTGDLHLGHARQAAVGDCICRLLTAVGYDVTREYYVNDAGNQINNLAKSLYARYQQALGIDAPFPEDGYHGSDIKDIAEELIQQHGDSLLDKPLDYFKEIGIKKELAKIVRDLDTFRVKFDVFTSERMLYNKGWVAEIIPYLTEKGYIYESEGAIWFKTTAFEDDKDRVLKKSDGSYTYLVPDIAYHRYKLQRGYDNLINILGADHHGYIKRLEAAITALGYKKEQIQVIIHQMVRLIKDGQELKMSKRTGKAYTLKDLCDEIGVDATRYSFASKNIATHMDLNIDDAVKKSNENPLYYIEYAHARCYSILKSAEEKHLEVEETSSLLTSPKEVQLLKHICEFEKVVLDAALTMSSYKITNYLYTLAQYFHAFYNDCKVIDENDPKITAQRIMLVKISRIVIKNGLQLIGVEALNQM